MDMKYLDKLEREFTERDSRRHYSGVPESSYAYAEELNLALKRGREYHAIAVNLAIHQVMAGLKKLIRSMARGRRGFPKDSSRAAGLGE